MTALLKRGFTLIELLLVLSIIAIMTLIGINRYHYYHTQMEIHSVQSDLSVIYAALNTYFHLIGCDSSGQFPVDKMSPNISALGLPTSYESRKPLIEKYSTHVINSTAETKSHKLVYVLQVTARLDSALSLKQLDWYAHLFHAGKMDFNTHTLIWQSLPGNELMNAHHSFWILDGARKVFRRSENGSDPNLTNYNNCVAS